MAGIGGSNSLLTLFTSGSEREIKTKNKKNGIEQTKRRGRFLTIQATTIYEKIDVSQI